MKKLLLYFFIITLSLSANEIEINNKTKYIDLLPKSQIYIDKTRKLNINEVKKKSFKANKKTVLGFGYNPNFDVWVRFTLKNTSNKSIKKIIEYDNPLSTNIEFFQKNGDDYKVFRDGSYYLNEQRSTKNPIFFINLKPNESKEYYIKTTSYITTLIIKIKLWDDFEFYNKEIKNQFILALFFGAMIVLGIYNLFIYFFSKDISYLFYVVYIFGIVFHHLLYVGIGNIYLFNKEVAITVTHMAALFVTIPIYSLALFTKTFLNTKQYKYWDRVLNIFLIIVPIFTALEILTNHFNNYRTLIVLILFAYLVVVTFYAAIKKNKQSYYILFGWSIILIGAILMFLSSKGVFDVFEYFPYIIETIIVLEALIFSIALAAKIKLLEAEKDDVHKKLMEQQKNEQIYLEEKVLLKTKELKDLNENLEQRVEEEIGHVKQMERKLFESEKMAAMGEMMGNIAHQWRQPLSVISTQASALLVKKDYGKLDDKSFDKSLKQILDMTKHLSQTIDDFRDYIRGDMIKERFLLSDVIEKSTSITHSSLKANYIQEVYDLDESIEIDSYENALIQSLVNIINNSRDAIKDRDIDLENRYLFINTYKDGKDITLIIKDSAGGIDEDIISRVFEPYFTTKNKSQGTGLGLHMTYNMVKNTMNGNIFVENIDYEYNSLKLKGAMFTIKLPQK